MKANTCNAHKRSFIKSTGHCRVRNPGERPQLPLSADQAQRSQPLGEAMPLRESYTPSPGVARAHMLHPRTRGFQLLTFLQTASLPKPSCWGQAESGWERK